MLFVFATHRQHFNRWWIWFLVSISVNSFWFSSTTYLYTVGRVKSMSIMSEPCLKFQATPIVHQTEEVWLLEGGARIFGSRYLKWRGKGGPSKNSSHVRLAHSDYYYGAQKFSGHYRILQGKHNAAADAISRLPQSPYLNSISTTHTAIWDELRTLSTTNPYMLWGTC